MKVNRLYIFFCRQSGSNESRWTVGLPGIMLSQSVSSSQAGMILNFPDDPGFGFEIHIMASRLVSNFISELRVTAVRELNGVTVECAGGNESFMSTIELVSIGEYNHRCSVKIMMMKNMGTDSGTDLTLD